jgi:hypothetical protein
VRIEERAQREAALADLDPRRSVGDVDLPSTGGVGMRSALRAPRAPGEERFGDARDHLIEIALAERRAPDAPQVELMRLTHVQPIDAVTPIDQPGTDAEQVLPVAARHELEK